MVLSDNPLLSPIGKKIGMVAVEASADLLGELLIKRLSHLKDYTLNISGVGGVNMLANGLHSLYSCDKLAVYGWSVFRHLPELFAIKNHLVKYFTEQNRIDLFMGIDAPDFNLRLAKTLRQKGIKTVQVVCPTIWFWRPSRVHQIYQSVDHVLCLFPFETQLLQQHSIPCTFIGHPLARHIPFTTNKPQAKKNLGVSPDSPTLAILPGSRVFEIHYLGQKFLQVAKILKHRYPDLQIILPIASGRAELVQQLIKEQGASEWVKTTYSDSHSVLAASDFALLASGTATLEACLFKVPMVVAYCMHGFNYATLRFLRFLAGNQLVKWISLPNILAGKEIVPEYIQKQATPEQLAQALTAWMDHPEKCSAVQEQYHQIHQSLLGDAENMSADWIQQLGW
ncbi:MAG: lipid-A-disaccharide synthase [Gammaproteobacteria bacterium]|nr:lipid-A-disaccharide synthase [Gammaproteobacteria bacterium]